MAQYSIFMFAMGFATILLTLAYIAACVTSIARLKMFPRASTRLLLGMLSFGVPMLCRFLFMLFATQRLTPNQMGIMSTYLGTFSSLMQVMGIVFLVSAVYVDRVSPKRTDHGTFLPPETGGSERNPESNPYASPG